MTRERMMPEPPVVPSRSLPGETEAQAAASRRSEMQESTTIRRRGASRVVRAALLLGLLLLGLLPLQAAQAGTWVGEEIVHVTGDAFADKLAPAVSDRYVVWEDRRHETHSVLYAKNLATGYEWQITPSDSNAREPDLQGDLVVWEDDRTGDWDIRAKNLWTGYEYSVVQHEGNQRRPDISGDLVAWEDGRSGEWDIWARRLSTSRVYPVTRSPGVQSRPAVSNGLIVWEDTRIETDSNIWGRRYSGGGEFRITNSTGWEDRPEVSGGTVVWRSQPHARTNSDIQGKRVVGKRNRVFNIAGGPSDQWSPKISGSVVIWVDNVNGNSDIYGKDLTDPTVIFRVSTGELYSLWPQDRPAIGGGMVAWETQKIVGTPEQGFGSYSIHGTRLGRS